MTNVLFDPLQVAHQAWLLQRLFGQRDKGWGSRFEGLLDLGFNVELGRAWACMFPALEVICELAHIGMHTGAEATRLTRPRMDRWEGYTCNSLLPCCNVLKV
jgi:hypothetical protein